MALASGHRTHNPVSRPSLSRLGPPIALAAAVLVTFGIVAVSPTTLPGGGSAVAIRNAALSHGERAALVAWCRRAKLARSGLTYWDVAGADLHRHLRRVDGRAQRNGG